MINLSTSLITVAQQPLNSKLFVNNLSELEDLGKSNYKAFYYYKNMIVHVLNNDEFYKWTEVDNNTKDKLLITDYIYPIGAISNGIDYSELSYNFIKLSKNPNNTSDLNNDGDGTSPFVTADGINNKIKVINFGTSIPNMITGSSGVDTAINNLPQFTVDNDDILLLEGIVYEADRTPVSFRKIFIIQNKNKNTGTFGVGKDNIVLEDSDLFVIEKEQLTFWKEPQNQLPDYSAIPTGNFTFNVIANSYEINNIWYSANQSNITISTPDNTNDRIDLIVVDVDKNISVIKGIASINPSRPSYNLLTQFPILWVLVPKNATNLSGSISSEIIYDEGISSEFTLSNTYPNIVQSTNSFSNGTKSIEISNNTSKNIVTLSKTPRPISNVKTLSFKLKLKEVYPAGLGPTQGRIGISLVNGLSKVGVIIFKHGQFGFNRNNLNWQTITINAESLLLSVGSVKFNEIRFYFEETFTGCFLDEIKYYTNTLNNPLEKKYTSQFINDGEDGINPFITVEDLIIGGRNLIIRKNLIPNSFVDIYNGTIKSTNGQYLQGLTPIEPNADFILYIDRFNTIPPSNISIVFYNSSGNYISGFNLDYSVVVLSTPYNFKTPHNATQFRMSGYKLNELKAQLEKGKIRTQWNLSPEDLKYTLGIEDENGIKKIDLKDTENLKFDKNLVVNATEKSIGLNSLVRIFNSRFTGTATTGFYGIKTSTITTPYNKNMFSLGLGNFIQGQSKITHYTKKLLTSTSSPSNFKDPTSIIFKTYLKPIGNIIGYSNNTQTNGNILVSTQSFNGSEILKINNDFTKSETFVRIGAFISGGISSQAIYITQVEIDANGVSKFLPEKTYQLRTSANGATTAAQTTFWLWMEIEIEFADATNANSENKTLLINQSNFSITSENI